MRWLLLILCYVFCFAVQENSFQKTQNVNSKSLEETKTNSDEEEAQSHFIPAQPSSPYYASFGVNFTYVNFYREKLFDIFSANSLLFALDLGWLQGKDRDFIVGLYLDGAAGSGKGDALYGIFGGMKLGGRLWGGRAVLFSKLGMSFMHFPFEHKDQQFNAYGLDAEAGVFVDIAKGMGVNLSYRYGYDYAYKIKIGRIHTSAVILGFAYYDLDLDW